MYLEKFYEATDVEWTHKPEFYVNLFKETNKDIYGVREGNTAFTDNQESNEKGYITTFIDNHKYISTEEKGIVNAYFTKMSDLNAKDRVELSKMAEDFILNETGLSEGEKQRILCSFAIFRYSSYYWEEYGAASPLKNKCGAYSAFDGLYLYQYRDEIYGSHDYVYGLNPNGVRIHANAAAFSIAACIVFSRYF
ncbi:MAG: hypothetical protein LBV02_02800 [Bacteroidales bacterium]|nr:hypothetical protein [Bacteroidales bacterium]